MRRFTIRCALSALFLLTWSLAPCVGAEDFYGYSEVLKDLVSANKNTDIKPTKFEADAKGGIIQLTMPDTSGKTSGTYEFQWKFLDSIEKMEPGKKYRFQVTGRRIDGTSEKNTCTCHGQSTQSNYELPKKAGIKRTGSDIRFNVVASSFDAYPPSKYNPLEGTLSCGEVEGTTYFGFQFDFSSWPYSDTSKKCSYGVSYVFKKNHVAPKATEIHCPTLYGLGFNIGIMEYGSLTDAKSEFLKNFVDDAIALMKASGCIPDSEVEYLEDLKARMLKVERTKAFAAEISEYRQKLTLLINRNCECDCEKAPSSLKPEADPEPIIKRLSN